MLSKLVRVKHNNIHDILPIPQKGKSKNIYKFKKLVLEHAKSRPDYY